MGDKIIVEMPDLVDNEDNKFVELLDHVQHIAQNDVNEKLGKIHKSLEGFQSWEAFPDPPVRGIMGRISDFIMIGLSGKNAANAEVSAFQKIGFQKSDLPKV